MVVEHAHGLRQRRGPNAKSSLHKAHLAPDAGLQAPGASLSFAQGSHDFESLDRGIGRGDRFETAHRLDQYLELSVIGLDHVIEILHLPVGRLPVQLSFAGTVAKLAMRQPFVLFKGLTFQKLCLPGAFRPGDHHNKMLRPGLCVVHASPQYL
ncbi:hypothetical protein AZ040_004740 [Escherichia coli]|nr:hypothetical protein AZ040_004740 [Escherichia coli]